MRFIKGKARLGRGDTAFPPPPATICHMADSKKKLPSTNASYP
jgi:hypothetical protein